jgi:hypothetical protein
LSWYRLLIGKTKESFWNYQKFATFIFKNIKWRKLLDFAGIFIYIWHKIILTGTWCAPKKLPNHLFDKIIGRLYTHISMEQHGFYAEKMIFCSLKHFFAVYSFILNHHFLAFNFWGISTKCSSRLGKCYSSDLAPTVKSQQFSRIVSDWIFQICHNKYTLLWENLCIPATKNMLFFFTLKKIEPISWSKALVKA